MDVIEAITRRRSCRAYRMEAVPQKTVLQTLEAARLAPSACNRQPWRFAVVTEAALRHRIVAEGFLPGIDMSWARDAPVHIVLGMERAFTTHRLAVTITGVDYPWVDLGIAGEHLVLQATELGLGTCWIGWIRPGRIRRIVGWPRRIRPAVVITLGFPTPEAETRAPTPRRELTDLTTWR